MGHPVYVSYIMYIYVYVCIHIFMGHPVYVSYIMYKYVYVCIHIYIFIFVHG